MLDEEGNERRRKNKYMYFVSILKNKNKIVVGNNLKVQVEKYHLSRTVGFSFFVCEGLSL